MTWSCGGREAWGAPAARVAHRHMRSGAVVLVGARGWGLWMGCVEWIGDLGRGKSWGTS